MDRNRELVPDNWNLLRERIPTTGLCSDIHSICTAAVVELFAMVYDLSNRHGESFTFKTSAFSQPKHGTEVCRNDCVQA